MKTGVAMLLLLAVLLGSGLGLVYTQHQGRQLFIELQKLQTQRDNLDIEWEMLQLEQSTLATEAIVDQAARNRLDMQIPAPETVIYVTR